MQARGFRTVPTGHGSCPLFLHRLASSLPSRRSLLRAHRSLYTPYTVYHISTPKPKPSRPPLPLLSWRWSPGRSLQEPRSPSAPRRRRLPFAPPGLPPEGPEAEARASEGGRGRKVASVIHLVEGTCELLKILTASWHAVPCCRPLRAASPCPARGAPNPPSP